MSFFSDSKPNLIGPKTKLTIDNMMKSQNYNYIISNKISSFFSVIFNDYIFEYKYTLLFILIITILLIWRYRYYTRYVKLLKKENFNEDNLFNEISFEQVKHLLKSKQPSVNPLKSINKQSKIKCNKENIINNTPITQFQNLNTPNYNYDYPYDNAREYYNGTYNTYENAQDTSIQHPYDFPTNFNTSTGDFVDYMTYMNDKNIVDYRTILDNNVTH